MYELKKNVKILSIFAILRRRARRIIRGKQQTEIFECAALFYTVHK